MAGSSFIILQGAFTLFLAHKSVTIPNSFSTCAPSTIRALSLPTDYKNCSDAVEKSRGRRHPDIDKTTDQIILCYGYSLEVHNVTTHDGYILTVHRITGGKVSPAAPGKPSVYLNHGMTASSDTWLLQYGDKNLAFKLADAGYDVWLGNCRGTTYSLGHVTLNSETDPEYWDFSWHEMAVGDVPAVVNKIISVTGNQKISYVGHSMGSTQYFVAFSMLPDLNEKIDKGILLAPIAFMGHSNNPTRLLAPIVQPLQALINPLIMGKIDWFTQFQKHANISLGDVCTPTALRCGLCDNVLYFLFGYDAPQQNYTNLANVLSKFPNNLSFRSLAHYFQSMNSCQFRQYNYGPIANRLRYGLPPKYNLTQITTPTYMIYGDADNFALPEDVQITRDHMRPETVKEVYCVDWDLWNHMDFLHAKDADTLVYDKVLDILQSPSD